MSLSGLSDQRSELWTELFLDLIDRVQGTISLTLRVKCSIKLDTIISKMQLKIGSKNCTASATDCPISLLNIKKYTPGTRMTKHERVFTQF